MSLSKKIEERIKTITPLQAFALISVIAMFVVGIKFFGAKKEWLMIRAEVKGKDWTEDFSGGNSFNPPPWLSNTIKSGDTEFGIDGKPTANIISVEQYGDVKPTIFVTAKIKVVASIRTGKYSYKNRAVEIGGPIELSLPKTKVLGQIEALNIPPEGYSQKYIIATVRIRNIEPWVVNKIAVGDKMFDRANNIVVAEILSKSTETPTSSVFTSSPGYFTNQFLVTNPRLKDIVLTLRLLLVNYPYGWRFAGNQILKVGSLDSPLKFSFADYNLPYVEVQDFHDETP